MAKIFNADIEVLTGADGTGKIGYDNGAFLGGFPVSAAADGDTLGWEHRGKLVRVDSSAAAATVNLVAASADVAGLMLFVQRDGANNVVIDPNGSQTISVGGSPAATMTLDENGAWVILVATATGWNALTTSGGSHIDVVDNDGVLLNLSGAGTASSPYELSAELVIDPDATNLLSNGAAGLYAGVVVGNGISGDGTAANPLTVTSIALTSVSVVADIAARDALTVEEGDVAKVLDDGDGFPQTYIYDGSAWVVIEDRGDVTSVNGQTGAVQLALGDLTSVDFTGLNAPSTGQVLQYNGSYWVPYTLPVTSYTGLVSVTPGSLTNISHNLDAMAVNFSALNVATDEYESVYHKRVDDDTLAIGGNVSASYQVRIVA